MSTKKDLELAHKNAATKIDSVQKAQTKRWLKNEYNVALRASIEEELEVLCSRDAITASADVQRACNALLEEHEDTLPRAVLDEKTEAFCAKAVPGCAGEAVESSVQAYTRKAKSEPPPKTKAERRLVRGVVARVVGSTFTKATREANKHVLVLVHNGSSSPKASQGYVVNDMRYSALISEFYALAVAVGNSSKSLSFAQLDLRKNDVPVNTPLADSVGVSMLLYLRGEQGGEPKSVPAVGEKSLAWADASHVRTQITQLLLSVLPDRDASVVRGLMKKREEALKANGSESGAPSGDGSAQPATSASPDKSAAAEASNAARPRKKGGGKKGGGREEAALVASEQCDLCGLVMRELEMALSATKAELEVSREAAARKQAQIDSVSRASEPNLP